MWQVIVTAPGTQLRSRVMMMVCIIQMRREQLRRLQLELMRDVVFGVSRATAITTTQGDLSPPHSSIIMAIIDQWAALLGTSSQQNLSSQVYCLGRGFVKGYSATEEPGPVITGKLMAGLIYCLLPPRSRLASSSLLCSTTTLNCFCFLVMTIIVYWILKLPLPLALPQMPQYNNLKEFVIR